MEYFEFAGKMYKIVPSPDLAFPCNGCAFNDSQELCENAPSCDNENFCGIFVETSQNALQQEQEASS